VNFGDNNGAKTANPAAQNFQFRLLCSGGQVDSCTFTMKVNLGVLGLSNWKIAGNLIPEEQITSTIATNVTPYTYTYTIKLRKTDIPGGKGLKDGDEPVISVDVVKNGCGVNVCAHTISWATQASIKNQYTTTTESAFVANPGDGYLVKLKVGTWKEELTSPDGKVCLSGVYENIGIGSIINYGTGDAGNLVVNINGGYLKPELIRYKTGINGNWVVPAPGMITQTQSLSAYLGAATCASGYVSKPSGVRMTFPGGFKLVAGDTLYFEIPCLNDYKAVIPAPYGTTQNQYNSWGVSLSYNSTDLCGERPYGGTYDSNGNWYFGGRNLTTGIYQSTYPTVMEFSESEVKTYSMTLYADPIFYSSSPSMSATLLYTTPDAKLKYEIRLPKSVILETGTSGDISVYRTSYPATVWPVHNFTADLSNAGYNFYTFELFGADCPSSVAGAYYSYAVNLSLKNSCAIPGIHQEQGEIKTIAYLMGDSGDGGCSDAVMQRNQVYCMFKTTCPDLPEGITYSAEWKRLTMGWLDEDNNNVPDAPGVPANPNKIDHYFMMPSDTCSFTWKGTVLEDGNKAVYAVLLLNGNYQAFFEIANRGEARYITLNGLPAGVQATLKNVMGTGTYVDIPVSLDRGTGVSSRERYAYVWEITKTDGTPFEENDEVEVSVAVMGHNTAGGGYYSEVTYQDAYVNSWMYVTAEPLAATANMIDPGTARKGEEEYSFTLKIRGPMVAGSMGNLNFTGIQNVNFGTTTTLNFLYAAGSNVTHTPYEYRHLTTPDSIVIELPEGYLFVNDNLTFNYYYALNNVMTVATPSPIVLQASGSYPNTSRRKTFVLGPEVFDVNYTGAAGLLPLSDTEWRLPFTLTIRSTYEAAPGGSLMSVTVYCDNHSYTQANIPRMQKLSATVDYAAKNTPSLIYTDPGSLKVLAGGNTAVEGTSEQLTWNVFLQQTKATGTASSGWLYVQGPVKDAKLVLNGQTYVGIGEDNCWIPLPDIAMGDATLGQLTVNYNNRTNNCEDITFKVYPLFDRTVTTSGAWTPENAGIAMTHTGFLAAQLDWGLQEYIYRSLNLKIKNVNSRISGSFTDLPSTPSDPASPSSGTYGLNTVSVGSLFPIELIYNTTGAPGMVVDATATLTVPVGLKYVSGSAYLEKEGINQSIASGSDLETELLKLDGTGLKTIILNIGTISGNSLSYLRFKLEPTCDIDLGKSEQLRAVFTGISSCGVAATGNGYKDLSSHLLVDGTIPSYSAVVTLNAPLTQMSCKSGEDTQHITVTFKKTNLPTVGLGATDSMKIIIPKALNISGLVSFSYPAVSLVSGNSGTVNADNYIDGENRVLAWPLPYNYYSDLKDNNLAASPSAVCRYELDLRFDKTLATEPVDNGQILVASTGGTKAGINCPSVVGFITSITQNLKMSATPVVGDIVDVEVCSGSSVSNIDLTGNFTVTGYGYRWEVVPADLTTAALIGMTVTSGNTAMIPGFVTTNPGIVSI
ncbi:MAG: hypothetical protein LBU57_03575, partial [Dysgonamonadaceae bacterium]|jgi:hypothetical protein|nr:hypothetical protein [Dysgonamonadaceae bacterium]